MEPMNIIYVYGLNNMNTAFKESHMNFCIVGATLRDAE